MRALLLILFVTCVSGFVVSSGIVPLTYGTRPASLDASALAHSLPVLLAVAAPAALLIAGLGVRALIARSGWRPVLAIGALVGIAAGAGYLAHDTSRLLALMAAL